MFGVSMWEILVVLGLLVVLVGPDRLPGLARSLGKALGKVRRSVDDIKQQTGLDEDLNFLEELRDMNRQISDGMSSLSEDKQVLTERPTPRKTRQRKGRQRVSGPRSPSTRQGTESRQPHRNAPENTADTPANQVVSPRQEKTRVD